MFRYPRLPHLLTTARGNGIQLLLIYHDLAQVEHLYGGREVARTVVSNAKLRMLLPGVADLETLRYWSDLMGQTRTQTHGTTTGTDGRRSRSSSEHADQLAPCTGSSSSPTDTPCCSTRTSRPPGSGSSPGTPTNASATSPSPHAATAGRHDPAPRRPRGRRPRPGRPTAPPAGPADAHLRHDLDQLAHDATDTLAGLLARLEDLETRGAPSATPAAWCWRDLGPHAHTELMEQLDTWTAWLRHRYPLARKIPGCWAQHPEVVEELTALWLAWQGAYQQPDAPLTAAADWHDRWLPGLLHRLERGPFATDCFDVHIRRPETSYADALGPLAMQNGTGSEALSGGTDPLR